MTHRNTTSTLFTLAAAIAATAVTLDSLPTYLIAGPIALALALRLCLTSEHSSA